MQACTIQRRNFIKWSTRRQGGGHATAKERRLSYRFHDPNPAAAAANCIHQVFIEANAGKVEALLQKAAAGGGGGEEPDRRQGRPA